MRAVLLDIGGVVELTPEPHWIDQWEARHLGTLNHQLIAYLKTLRPSYAMAILSNSFVGAREREEARYGFAAHFHPIIYSHEEGMQKPEPDF